MLVVETAAEAPPSVTALGVPVAGGDELELLGGNVELGGTAGERARALLPGRLDEAWVRQQGFAAKSGQSLVLRSAGGAPSVVLLGLGERAGMDAERWRRAAAALVRMAGEGGTAALVLPGGGSDGLPGGSPGGDPATVGSAVAEGAVLAAYRFDGYRSAPRPPAVERVVLVSPGDRRSLDAGIRRGSAVARAVTFARDLINTPAGDLTPSRMAERVTDALSGLRGTETEVWDEQRIALERLGGVQTVARGSAEPPRFVRATYVPDGAGEHVPHVVLVGKGITFDSGGLSLKPADAMTAMKTDMSGAAIVLSVLSTCAELEVPVRVTALAPLTENMPGGRAVKPGDVFAARNGSTIEVLNTDAEGRLVLADALSLAAELAPDAIVDVATLTGAARIALGSGVAPVLGTDEDLVERVRAAGQRAGERFWPLPLPDDYADHIESDVADMKNMGRPREAGVIAAAMLLKRFVADVPWAHLDIAGTGRAEESSGYVTKGGTAFGVRTLVELLAHYDR